ncbi:MAG: hypothetical protein HYV65_00920 [Candidatus Spechtbacteria bacterium]|nr:hypothetical protein [Candidatus Spechtbacteria bacterium]
MNRKFILFGLLFVAAVVIAVFLAWYNFGRNLGSFAELSVGMKTPEELVTLAKRFEEARQFEDAASSYKAAIDLEPGLQLAAYSALSRIYSEELSEKDSGLAHVYLRGLAESPKSRVLMRGLAEHYERIGEYVPAFQWYQKIVEMYPQDRYMQIKITELQKKF